MTQKEKQLLLQDLCARLPYGVIVDYKENKFETPHWKIKTIYPETLDGWIGYDEKVGAGSESGSRHFEIGQYRPYLRPMSSMTEEEREEWADLFNLELDKLNEIDDENEAEELAPYYFGKSHQVSIDWLNEHYFDYRGLIELGLALEAPKGMYEIQN